MHFVRPAGSFCGVLALAVLCLPLLQDGAPAGLHWVAVALGHLGAWVLGAVLLGICLIQGWLDWISGSVAGRWVSAYAAHMVLGLVSLALVPEQRTATAQLALAAALLAGEIVYFLVLLHSGIWAAHPARNVRRNLNENLT